MKKVNLVNKDGERVGEMSAEGLRILRTEGELRLSDWAKAEANGYPPTGDDAKRREGLRTAVGEANDRLARVDAREGE